jgi:predicted Rossmann fold nucleotide-binding protein DprA/Smf involved in DNA uptake
VLTPLDPHYPRRWPASLAPPALWVEGDPSILSLPGVSVAGSRELPHSYTRFAEAAGAAPTGGCLVSGGAPGADTLAERAATVPVIEILPAGFSAWPSPAAAAVRLSLWPPEAPFSAAAAMERNALIYAFSVITIVCHARFKQGGSWHGAISALRRRLSVLLVPEDSELAHRALVALGARAVPAEALSTAILEPGPALQPLLQ